MAFSARTRLVNPRLGTYYGIFTAGFVALVMMALMLEQLAISDGLVRLVLFAGPLALYAGLGLLSPAHEAREYFAAGRRVPAFFNGLVLGITALGGAGFLALTGSFLISGFDAFCLSIGWYAGLVFMGVLFAPFVRKFGAYTVPTFLGRRFESRTVRLVSAATLGVSLLLLLAAEARFAAYAAAWLMGQSERLMAIVVVAFATVLVFAGGMRALSWGSVGKAIVAMLALAVPATIVAIMVSNLPLPQMTHGNILRVVTRLEVARGVPIIIVPPLTFDLPGVGIEQLSKRFIQAFGSVGSLGFVLMSFVVAAGVAASPALLARSGTTPGVYEARKSIGWAVLVAGLVLLTLPAVAVYLRAQIVEQVLGQPIGQLPIWFQLLQQAGIVHIEAKTQIVALSNIGFERDAALFALPIASGFPQALVYVSLAGALAAALAALAAAMTAGAAILAEDVINGLSDETPPDPARIATARICLLGIAFITAWLALAAPGDPLRLMLWALNLTAASSFPVLFLAIWWKRANAWGAMVGMITGITVALFLMLLAETGAIGLPSVLAGAVALPMALAATVIATLTTPAPGRSAIDVVREVRVPGGETIYDRELRLMRLKNRTPP